MFIAIDSYLLYEIGNLGYSNLGNNMMIIKLDDRNFHEALSSFVFGFQFGRYEILW